MLIFNTLPENSVVKSTIRPLRLPFNPSLFKFMQGFN